MIAAQGGIFGWVGTSSDLLERFPSTSQQEPEKWLFRSGPGVISFALFLDRSATLRGLYLDAEAESGYVRDRNVFGEPITIEDTMTVTARYRNGALLSYCLVAYAPWEGLRVAITGDHGRVELDVVENVTHLMSDDDKARASKGSFKEARVRVCPMFGGSTRSTFRRARAGTGAPIR